MKEKRTGERRTIEEEKKEKDMGNEGRRRTLDREDD